MVRKHNINKRTFAWAEGVALGARGGSIPDAVKTRMDESELEALELGVSVGRRPPDVTVLEEWARIECPICQQVRMMPFASSTTCPHCQVEMVVVETHATAGYRIIGGDPEGDQQ